MPGLSAQSGHAPLQGDFRAQLDLAAQHGPRGGAGQSAGPDSEIFPDARTLCLCRSLHSRRRHHAESQSGVEAAGRGSRCVLYPTLSDGPALDGGLQRTHGRSGLSAERSYPGRRVGHPGRISGARDGRERHHGRGVICGDRSGRASRQTHGAPRLAPESIRPRSPRSPTGPCASPAIFCPPDFKERRRRAAGTTPGARIARGSRPPRYLKGGSSFRSRPATARPRGREHRRAAGAIRLTLEFTTFWPTGRSSTRATFFLARTPLVQTPRPAVTTRAP